jgi:hypothetical protein
MLVSSAEASRAFNAGFDTVNLHRPTLLMTNTSLVESPPLCSGTG